MVELIYYLQYKGFKVGKYIPCWKMDWVHFPKLDGTANAIGEEV